MKRVFVLFMTLLCAHLHAQTLPIIKANSKLVDIKDGDEFKKGNWTISPQIKPDVYTTSPGKHKVSFYTDIDSISFTISSNGFYAFNILLNKKDTAYTAVFAPDYLKLLQQAATYNSKDKRPLPAFTYQDSNNPNLVALRKAFNLDSIAGFGNEASRIINVMHWIHDLVPHDGNHDNPVVKNAMSMIAECKKDKRGLNCRGLATVLNECYLALGIPSRFVTCLPKDSLGIDNDCHVINAVYVAELDKWIWIDPTNDAYIMNEKGELLSIEEVRERLVNGKTLIVNPDANWNHKSSVVKEYYLQNYMAKNLYMLQCYASSEYDTETWGNDKTVTSITLLPLEYYKQTPDKSEFANKEIKTRFVNYKTNNPALFWAKPE